MRYNIYLLAWTVALTILFYVISHANAADYSIRFGPGIDQNRLTGATKSFGLRHEEDLMDGIYTGFEVGGYADTIPGRSSAGVVKAQLGVKPGPEVGIYGFGFVGPCGISATDTYLSTNVQFCTDVGLGVRDRKTFMNAGYMHISNAGIRLPNRGKDYLIFSVGVSL